MFLIQVHSIICSKSVNYVQNVATQAVGLYNYLAPSTYKNGCFHLRICQKSGSHLFDSCSQKVELKLNYMNYGYAPWVMPGGQ